MDVAFEWDARVRLAPFIRIRVQDAYRNGKGAGRVSILSAITIAKERDSAELTRGSLFRFLAEAPWYPSVLVPSGRLRWDPIDSSRARAALTDQGLTVTLEFRFDSAGYIAAIYTDARPRKTGGGYEMAAWEGHFTDYAERDGIRVPLRGEVGWYAGGTWMPVWRGRIVEARYQFLP